MGVSKVVIGFDPSDRARKALDIGIEVASAVAAEIHLVTAFVDGTTGGVEITAERRRAEQQLDGAARRITSSAVTVHQHAIPAPPAAAIVRVATETGADMIVIGNRGAQGVTRVLGSVASAVVGHAPCSVLVVKTD